MSQIRNKLIFSSWLCAFGGSLCVQAASKTEVSGNDQIYDEPQMLDQERLEEDIRRDSRGEPRMVVNTILDVAQRVRPQVGFESSPGVFIRVAMNGTSFPIGHPPRLFVFLENPGAQPLMVMGSGSMIWDFLEVQLHDSKGKEVKPTVLYEFRQAQSEFPLALRAGLRPHPDNSNYLFAGKIEDAFGSLAPDTYTLEVKVHPSRLYFLKQPVSPPATQRFAFEIRRDKHPYWTNALPDDTAGYRKLAEDWVNERHDELILDRAKAEIGLPTAASQRAQLLEQLTASPEPAATSRMSLPVIEHKVANTEVTPQADALESGRPRSFRRPASLVMILSGMAGGIYWILRRRT